EALDAPGDRRRMRMIVAAGVAVGQAEDRVEDAQRMLDLSAGDLDHGGYIALRAEQLEKMSLHRRDVPAELAPRDEVVADAVLPPVGVGDAQRPRKPVDPGQPRMAQHPAAPATERLVEVSLLGAEAAQPW